MEKRNIIAFFLMHLGFLVYSLSTILAKFAARYEVFSIIWFFLYAGVVCVLGIYAIIWQQVLKRFTLSFGMCNKSMTIIWGMILSFIFFGEEITIKKIAGACIILCGIVMLSTVQEQPSVGEEK